MLHPTHRILFVSTVMAAETHGPSRKLMLLRRAFIEENMNISVHVITEDPSVFYPGDTIVKVNYPKWLEPISKLVRSWIYAKKVKQLCAKESYSHVIFNDAPKAWILSIIGAPKDTQLVAMLNDYENLDPERRKYERWRKSKWRAFIGLFERMVARRADLVICCSGYLATRVQETYGLVNRPSVLNPALDLDEWKTQEPRPFPEKPSLIFVKSDALRGGLQDLLLALKDPDLASCFDVLHIGGTPTDTLDKLVGSQLDLPIKVQLHGPLGRKKFKSKLAAADIGIVASHHEAYGITAREYLAAGLRLVVSNAGGLPEATQESVCFSFDVGDPYSLKLALKEALKARDIDQASIQQTVLAGYGHIDMALRFTEILSIEPKIGISD